VRFPSRPRLPLQALAPVAAVMLALLAGAVLIAAVGQSPLEVYGMLAQQALGTGYGVGQTLFKATPLLFAGLSVALAFRAGLFNVGAEGQMYLGGFAAGLVGAYAPLPAPLMLPAALAAAAVAGGAWGAIPGALKARFGAHEVINTIMLNFIAFSLVSWWGRSLFVPATVRTREVAAAARVPRLDVVLPWLKGSPANLTLLLGVALAVALGVYLFRTRRGYELRVLGWNPGAAEYAGVRIGRAQVFAFALAVELCIAFISSGLKALDSTGPDISRPAGADTFGSPGAIGELLLTDFLLPFEAASFLLLMAAVGAVVLARRRRGLEDEGTGPMRSRDEPPPTETLEVRV